MKNVILLLITSISFFGNSQAIDLNTIKVNGEIKAITTLKELKSKIEIDSIISVPELMDMSTADSLIYIGNSYFEYTTKDNKCISASIDFDEKINSLIIGRIKLDKSTSYESLKDNYPISCSELKPMKVYNDSKNYNVCSIPIKDSEKNLLCFFNKEKLIRIEL
ncbi:hypothetical protein [Robertkochia flava]|uniref:hypothetical protein n=1 Tax=Robertkochia flava TaxID=3447986 RepID=UPI001CCBC506|nr:hypothetical protein [Robertkochia marina]